MNANKRFLNLKFGASLVLGAWSLELLAGPLKIQLPPETASFKTAAGSDVANGQCLTCHSVEYVLTQPPFPASFWAAEVKKMQDKYGASIPQNQIEVLVKYLSDNYGLQTNLQPITAAAPPANAAPAISPAENIETFATRYGCLACHNANVKIVGPPYKDVAAKYRSDPEAITKIVQQIHNGGSGKWGSVLMPPFPMLTDQQARMLAGWVMAQGK
jgi:sulfite dehydrogenase